MLVMQRQTSWKTYTKITMILKCAEQKYYRNISKIKSVLATLSNIYEGALLQI